MDSKESSYRVIQTNSLFPSSQKLCSNQIALKCFAKYRIVLEKVIFFSVDFQKFAKNGRRNASAFFSLLKVAGKSSKYLNKTKRWSNKMKKCE